jgi:ubiquinone/menaquinone biosynthesis C-methylase UbiE
MASKGVKVFALDIASNIPQELSDNNSQVVFIKGDATSLPFDADKFDFVICPFVLEHVADVEVVVREMFRVLKKGGNLLIAIPVIPIEGLLPRLNKRLYLDFFHWRAFSPLPFSLSWKMNIFELLRYIKSSGGTIVKYEGVWTSTSNDMKPNNNILHKVKVAAMKHLWPFKYFGEQAIVLCKKT